MRRREFLAALAASTLAACTSEAEPLPPGSFSGADPAAGHRLRDQTFPAPSETQRHGVVILGGGVAGLSAAWRLQRAGCTDFALYEMADRVGGNARAGANAISAYPQGAHYLPLPPPEARAVRTLLADLGVLQSGIDAAMPVYDERYLCHALQERLYRNGSWQEGLVPAQHLDAEEARQIQAFHAHMQRMRKARGQDGRRAFAVPRACSSTDVVYTGLDSLSMGQWMTKQGYTAAPLRWYVDYACRDDFGTHLDDTSAWAGIHYFACRDDQHDVVITAPAGNGWIVQQLEQRLRAQLHTDAMVVGMGQQGGLNYADIYRPASQTTLRIEAQHLICALPLMVVRRVWKAAPPEFEAHVRHIEYAPWLVANLSLRALPAERRGAPPAWDNVLYGSDGLGYVIATHQSLQTRPGPTIFTYYRALAEDPDTARRLLLARSHAEWSEEIIAELSRVHPDIRSLVAHIEIARYGHAMARPRPGQVWAKTRTALLQGFGNIHLAHADLSAFSIFEEANYHGVAAAERILRSMGRLDRSLL